MVLVGDITHAVYHEMVRQYAENTGWTDFFFFEYKRYNNIEG